MLFKLPFLFIFYGPVSTILTVFTLLTFKVGSSVQSPKMLCWLTVSLASPRAEMVISSEVMDQVVSVLDPQYFLIS